MRAVKSEKDRKNVYSFKSCSIFFSYQQVSKMYNEDEEGEHHTNNQGHIIVASTL